MPQYTTGRTLDDDILGAVISNWLTLPGNGYTTTATDIMNKVADLKAATLPGDTTALIASIITILKSTDQDTIFVKADEISALIV